jgi:hypothetical protein
VAPQCGAAISSIFTICSHITPFSSLNIRGTSQIKDKKI